MIAFFFHSRRRAQMSAEAIIIFGIILSLLALLLVVFSIRETSLTYERERLKAQELSDSVSTATALSFIIGSGSNVSVRLPSTISGSTYQLLFGTHILIATWDNRAISSTSVAPLNTSVAVPATLSVPRTATARYADGVVNLVN